MYDMSRVGMDADQKSSYVLPIGIPEPYFQASDSETQQGLFSMFPGGVNPGSLESRFNARAVNGDPLNAMNGRTNGWTSIPLMWR